MILYGISKLSVCFCGFYQLDRPAECKAYWLTCESPLSWPAEAVDKHTQLGNNAINRLAVDHRRWSRLAGTANGKLRKAQAKNEPLNGLFLQ